MSAVGSFVRRAWLPLGLLAAILLFIVACVPRAIDDLRFIEAQRLAASSIPDRERGASLERQGIAVWRVSFEGDAGWPAEVNRHGLNGWVMAVRCDQRDQGVFADGPYVGTQLVSHYAPGLDSFDPGDRQVLRYDIYIADTGRFTSEAANAPTLHYDLSQQPLDLCISMGGGAMHGAYARSNEVRVRIGGS